MGVVRAVADAAGDHVGRDSLGGRQRGSTGLVWGRPGRDGSAGGQAAGTAKPDARTGGEFREFGSAAISKMGGGRRKNERGMAGGWMGFYHRKGDVIGRVP